MRQISYPAPVEVGVLVCRSEDYLRICEDCVESVTCFLCARFVDGGGEVARPSGVRAEFPRFHAGQSCRDLKRHVESQFDHYKRRVSVLPSDDASGKVLARKFFQFHFLMIAGRGHLSRSRVVFCLFLAASYPYYTPVETSCFFVGAHFLEARGSLLVGALLSPLRVLVCSEGPRFPPRILQGQNGECQASILLRGVSLVVAATHAETTSRRPRQHSRGPWAGNGLIAGAEKFSDFFWPVHGSR